MSIISDNSKLKFQCLVFSFREGVLFEKLYYEKKNKKKKEKLSTDALFLLHCYLSTGAGMSVLGSERK